MAQYFNPKYKEVLKTISEYDLSELDKVALVIEELCETKDENNDYIFDYGTIAKAVMELLGKGE